MANDIVKIHPDMGQFLRDIVAAPAEFHSGGGRKFYGYVNAVEAVAYVRQGAAEHSTEYKAAIALLDKVDASTHGRKKVQAMPSVAGERVNIGAYLRGEPQNMRRRVRVEHDRAPLRIVMEGLVSAETEVEQLVRRGAAMVALAVRLAEVRPVELYVAWSQKTRGTTVTGMVKLDTQPLSMAQAVAVLATPQFCRTIAFTEAYRLAGNVADGSMLWGWGQEPTQLGRNRRVREALQLEPQDIFIPGGYISEAAAWMKDPVAWVNSYLDSQREAE